MSGFFARGRGVDVAASLLHNGANINARFFLLHGGDDKYDDNGVDQHHCDDEPVNGCSVNSVTILCQRPI